MANPYLKAGPGRPKGSTNKGSFIFSKVSREFWEEEEKISKTNKLLLEYLDSEDSRKEMFAIDLLYKYFVIPVSKQLEMDTIAESTITVDNKAEVLEQIHQRILALKTKTEE